MNNKTASEVLVFLVVMQRVRRVSTAGLHLCESLSAALALAAASLLVIVDWEFPLPALMEALLTWP